MTPGDTVLINSGRYMLNHAVIEQLHPEHGPHGFATVRFIGLSGTPLKRRGWSKAPPLNCRHSTWSPSLH